MEEAIERINELRPKYVFVTVKSGAGKTYFSNRLDGYKVLELDGVVESTGEAFGLEWPESFKMYKNSLPAPIMDAFVANIHSFFQQHLDSPIVVEGAIADAELIKKIFSGPYAKCMFLYLYPVDVHAYTTRVMKRFIYEKENGIQSLSIWPQVTPELEEAEYDSKELKEFMIRMAHESMAMSAQRYDYFEKSGLDMIRVESDKVDEVCWSIGDLVQMEREIITLQLNSDVERGRFHVGSNTELVWVRDQNILT